MNTTQTLKKTTWLAVCLTALLVAGCGENQEGNKRTYVKNDVYCQQDSKNARSDFILRCIANANPKSDEEPEDWIRDCQKMAEETLCKRQSVRITEECKISSFGSCDFWREVNRRLIGN